MMDFKFTYRGKELLGPLLDLVKFLEKEEEELAYKVNSFDRSLINKHSIMPDPEAQKLTHLESKLKNVRYELTRAKNWIRECRRTPREKWILDFQDLEWIYRQKPSA